MNAKSGAGERAARNFRLSERIGAVKPSATLAITAMARDLRAQGVDVIGFGAGEPDFDTPEAIVHAAVEALQEGFTRYTASSGIPELRAAIARKLERDNNAIYQPEEIVVTVGAKQALYSIFQILLDPGDEVIVPAPYWVSYVDLPALAHGTPIVCPLDEENGFDLDPDGIERCLSPATRAVIVNSPSNPTGAVYSRGAVEAVMELAIKHGLLVITDEIYEKIVYGGAEALCPAGLGNDAWEHTLVVNGFSKAYAMTGWRLGFVAGPRAVIDAIGKFQTQGTNNPTSFVQKAAVVAMDSPDEVFAPMVEEFRKRRDYMVGEFNKMDGVSCFVPQGAFYAFPNVGGLFGRSSSSGPIESSAQLCEYLLEEGKIAVVPGSAFGAEGFVRFSYATSMENIRDGMERMADAISKLK